MLVNVAEQTPPFKEQVQDEEYLKDVEDMSALGEKLSQHEGKLLQKANAAMVESGTAETTYHASHVEAAVGFGQELVNMVMQELGKGEESQAQEKISSLVRILLKWHDAKLKQEANLLSAEEASAAALTTTIKDLGIDLSPAESRQLRGAIEATQIDSDQVSEQKLVQSYEKGNLLQGIICAADLGLFALGDFKQFVELSLRFFVETDQLNQEDLDAWLEFSGLTDKAMQVLPQQIKYLTQYEFPTALPSAVKQELEERKAARIEKLQVLLEEDEGESRMMSAMGGPQTKLS